MGDFELFSAFFSVAMLAVIMYNVMTALTFKDILSSFNFMKNSRKDFYECGFRPQTQSPMKISLQFLLMCVFFLLYDIELVMLFPWMSGYTHSGFYDLYLFVFFFLMLFVSLLIDYESHALYWQQ